MTLCWVKDKWHRRGANKSVENKLWLYTNIKIKHAVFTVCASHFACFGETGGFHYHFCTAPVFKKLGSSTQVLGFTKHHKMSAAFTTLSLDSISTELTTELITATSGAKQAHSLVQ